MAISAVLFSVRDHRRVKSAESGKRAEAEKRELPAWCSDVVKVNVVLSLSSLS